MELNELISRFGNCSCGKNHTTDIKAIHIAPGIIRNVGKLLHDVGFPKDILLVADENTIAVARDVFDALNGFKIKEKIYKNMREPLMSDVDEIVKLSSNCDGILSVGSGTLNDICRLASFRAGKEFAILATAPSMDGFASKDAPIIADGFKSSYAAKQPSIIIGDTEILAQAPTRLKSAGFGDMMGKYVALVDWQVARLFVGEYFCQNVYNLTQEATDKIFEMAATVTAENPQTAGSIMQCLILTGMGMKFTGNSRPASGTEHIVSHYWDITKLIKGEQPDFHGLQVGMATLLIADLYNDVAKHERACRRAERTDWNKVYHAYGNMKKDIINANMPSVMDDILPSAIEKNWQTVREYIWKYLDTNKIKKAMQVAGCPVDISEIGISKELCKTAMEYHPYMRRRMTLARALPAMEFLN